jgi:hypothetical protein
MVTLNSGLRMSTISSRLSAYMRSLGGARPRAADRRRSRRVLLRRAKAAVRIRNCSIDLPEADTGKCPRGVAISLSLNRACPIRSGLSCAYIAIKYKILSPNRVDNRSALGQGVTQPAPHVRWRGRQESLSFRQVADTVFQRRRNVDIVARWRQNALSTGTKAPTTTVMYSRRKLPPGTRSDDTNGRTQNEERVYRNAKRTAASQKAF